MFGPDVTPSGWLGSKHQLTNLVKSHETCWILWQLYAILSASIDAYIWQSRVLGLKGILDSTSCPSHGVISGRSTLLQITLSKVPTDSPLRGGDVALYVFNINQPSLPTPSYSVLVSISVVVALSSVFHSIHSPDNSPLSRFVLPVLFLPYWLFQLYISLWKSSSAPI